MGSAIAMKKIYQELILNKPENLFDTNEMGMQRALTEPNYAIVSGFDAVSVSGYACHLMAVPGELPSEQMSFVLPRHSSYTNLFSHL